MHYDVLQHLLCSTIIAGNLHSVPVGFYPQLLNFSVNAYKDGIIIHLIIPKDMFLGIDTSASSLMMHTMKR